MILEDPFVFYGIFKLPSQQEIKVFLVVLIYCLVFIYTREWYRIGAAKIIQRLSHEKNESKKDKINKG